MKRRMFLPAVALCAATALPVHAGDGLPSLPAVQAVRFVADCAHPVLPRQREVADWTGLHNFGQVYAARGRLMLGVARACRQPGIARVQVVMAAGTDRRVAFEPAPSP